MAVKRLPKTVLRKSNLLLSTHVYENVGDVETAEFKNVEAELFKDRYHVRHVLLKGQGVMSFPGSAEPDIPFNPGDVFPANSVYLTNNGACSIVSTMADSRYFCVIPGYANRSLVEETTILSTGQSRNIPMGTVAFVFSNNYTVNGNSYSENQIFACENSSAVVVSNTDNCKVLEYRIL